MKKKIWITVLAVVALLAVLFVPVPGRSYDDGGTREYTALTYKIVRWNRLSSDGTYTKTRVYGPGQRWKSIDSLWELERENVPSRFVATVIELSDTMALVEPMEWEDERRSSDAISFAVGALPKIGAQVGDTVEVTYDGQIRESYPASIDAVSWTLVKDLRHRSYGEQWLDKTKAEAYDTPIFGDIVITQIYSDCFFARPVVPSSYTIKLNGTLSEQWCVGDQIITTYQNTYYDAAAHRVEADLLTVAQSDFQMDPGLDYKPVIYLYPPEQMEVSVELALDGRLTCTYPAYGEGWSVTAAPDGTLTDGTGQIYNYLYWEGETYARYDLSRGFCVKGEDTAAFLEGALEQLGLTRREANEFIVYWLPQMEPNEYNIISFQTDVYTEAAKLTVEPAPDTLIRVFMAWQASDRMVELPPQALTAPPREGFTVVEWGGTEL